MTRKLEDSHSEIAVGDVIEAAALDGTPLLARLLRSEGVDLTAATDDDLGRGTPVFVDATASALTVQRLMARFHIRSILVLDREKVVGVADLLELAQMDFEASNGSAPSETESDVSMIRSTGPPTVV